MPIECPECGSQDVRKVSMVYEMGVQKTRSHSMGGGAALSLLGPIIGAGGSISRGRHESLLAARIGPPKKRRPVSMAVLVFFGMGSFGMGIPIVLGVVFGNVVAVIAYVAYLIALFALPLYILVDGFRYNKKLPRLLAKWENLFVCERCGEVFNRVQAHVSRAEPENVHH